MAVFYGTVLTKPDFPKDEGKNLNNAVVKRRIGVSEVPYLADSRGHTLYMFTGGQPTNGSWKPFLVTSQNLPDDYLHRKLGTILRPDGERQYIYGPNPLYYYQADERPGEVKGVSIDGASLTWAELNLR